MHNEFHMWASRLIVAAAVVRSFEVSVCVWVWVICVYFFLLSISLGTATSTHTHTHTHAIQRQQAPKSQAKKKWTFKTLKRHMLMLILLRWCKMPYIWPIQRWNAIESLSVFSLLLFVIVVILSKPNLYHIKSIYTRTHIHIYELVRMNIELCSGIFFFNQNWYRRN